MQRRRCLSDIDMIITDPHAPGPLADRIAHLEAALDELVSSRAIRHCVTRYMELCDQLDGNTPFDELGELFTRDAVWEGKGARYAQGFGGFKGRQAIRAMLQSYAGPEPHFRMNAHFLCSECIEVHGGSGSADASWLMLQTSTFANGASHLNAAQLKLRMALEEGRWRIAHFQTENVFSRPVDHWDSSAALPLPPR